MNTFNTLLEATIEYLEQIKEETPYLFSSILKPVARKPLPTPSVEPLSAPPLLKSPREVTPREILAPKVSAPPQKAPPPKELPPAMVTPKETPLPEPAPAAQLALHPPKAASQDSMEDLRTLLQKVAPSLKLHERIPSDTQAKKVKNAWKEQVNIPDVVILSKQDGFFPFLQNIAKAITWHFLPSRVIDISPLEAGQRWEAFLNNPQVKMILAPDTLLWSCPHLMRYYHEFPHEQKRFLGKIPLLLLPDLGLYLKDPALKRSLWNVLCQILTPLKK